MRARNDVAENSNKIAPIFVASGTYQPHTLSTVDKDRDGAGKALQETEN